jgi:hypothetical protein
MVDYYTDGKLPTHPEQGRLVFPKCIYASGDFRFFHFACTKTCHMFLPYSQSIPSSPDNLDSVQIYLLSPKNVPLLELVFFLP